MNVPGPTTSSSKPGGTCRPPTNEPFPWNDDFHRRVVEECDQQDRINWECKLEALAHLLSVAEAKWAITTAHSRLDTRYIEAMRLVCEARMAMD